MLLQSKCEYKKLGLIYKGYAGKIYLIEKQQGSQDSENQDPNSLKKSDSGLYVLKKYFRKKNESLDLNMLNEYSILSGLDHPNLVIVKDAFVEKLDFKNNICLSMELMCPLQSLSGKLSEGEIQFIFSQIVSGLRYLHLNGILHRDVKPPNIFITSNGLVKVGDFGISKRIQADMTPTTCTKNYRAPELFFGERNYDMSIDIWALGCTLVELLTGQILFPGKSEIEILGHITDTLGGAREETWPGCTQLPNYLEFSSSLQKPLSQILEKSMASKDAIELIEKMLTLDPKKRPSICEIQQSSYVKLATEQSKISKLAQKEIDSTQAKFTKKIIK